jgi:hypothetical protein
MFSSETPLSARWRALAQAKLDELDVLRNDQADAPSTSIWD